MVFTALASYDSLSENSSAAEDQSDSAPSGDEAKPQAKRSRPQKGRSQREEAGEGAGNSDAEPVLSASVAFKAVHASGLPIKEAVDARLRAEAAARKREADFSRREKVRLSVGSSDSDRGSPTRQPTVEDAASAYGEFLAEAALAQAGPQQVEVYEDVDGVSAVCFAGVSLACQAELREAVTRFVLSEDAVLDFAPSLSNLDRKFVHGLAEKHGLVHASHGFGAARAIRISRKGGKRARHGV